ncbi:uncharacterized protein BO95DRAFT_104358 [Aspergillus brunneoviolaceus CBS 621.78]|uniref:Uncharacterized protein n=1 Tax=Aspergillus brunneoviolaceus CBS 621.78 TaxID=1450534 RepID=A0ACD1GBP3_9EURO|nr:hypothetical protein BO95DRAFT_104358 [Aspergillus brunneoviolaceus CBS 621.78]RAH46600.1 hypothetical protein BO95DRAFT_104358 [Aspergillus brunneoviolaceus CBS 621.78]
MGDCGGGFICCDIRAERGRCRRGLVVVEGGRLCLSVVGWVGWRLSLWSVVCGLPVGVFFLFWVEYGWEVLLWSLMI